MNRLLRICTLALLLGLFTAQAEPPRIFSLPPPFSVNLGKQESPIVIQLAASEYGNDYDSRFQWFLNGSLFRSGSGDPTLTFLDITPNMVGDYVVRLFNKDGSVDSKPIRMTVIERNGKNLNVRVGQTLVLTLDVAVPPGETLVWQHNGVPLEFGGRIRKISDTGVSISGMTIEDAGQYDAGAYNSLLGTRAVTVVTKRPTWNPLPSDTVQAGMPYQLNLYEASNSDPLNPASKFRISGLPFGLTCDLLTGLVTGNANAVGTFHLTLHAENAAGDSTTSMTLVVTPLPATLTGTYVAQIRSDPHANIFWSYFRYASQPSYEKQLTLTVTNNGMATFRLRLDSSHVISGVSAGHLSGPGLDFQGFAFGTVTPDGRCRFFTSYGNEMRGWKQTWNEKKHPAANYAGAHTFILGKSPSLWGVGSVNVSKAGVATVTGSVRTGASFATVMPLGPDGEAMFNQFRGVQEVPTSGESWIVDKLTMGTLQLDSGGTITGDGLLIDVLPTVGYDQPLPKFAADKARGGLYTAPKSSDNLLGVRSAPGNARLVFDWLLASANVALDLSAPARVSVPTGLANPASTTLAIEQSTGFFSGSFMQPSSKGPVKGMFRGVILETPGGATIGAGYYRLPGPLSWGPNDGVTQFPPSGVRLESNL